MGLGTSHSYSHTESSGHCQGNNSTRSKGGWLLGQGLFVSVPLPVLPSTWVAAMMRTWERVRFCCVSPRTTILPCPMLPWSPHQWACGIPHRCWRRTCQSTSGSSGGHPSPHTSSPAGGPCSSGNQTSQPWCPPCTWRDLWRQTERTNDQWKDHRAVPQRLPGDSRARPHGACRDQGQRNFTKTPRKKEPQGPKDQRSGKSLGTWEKPPLGYPAVLLHRTLRGTSGSGLVLDNRGSGQCSGSEQ